MFFKKKKKVTHFQNENFKLIAKGSSKAPSKSTTDVKSEL